METLRELQLRRLQWSVRHAYDNVPHYRARFGAAGLTPDDIRSLEDLAKFPFTTKEDLRDNYPFGLFAVPREEIVRLHASSGTTGKPTVVGYTAGDIDMWSDVVARSIQAAGGKSGQTVFISYGYGLFTGGLGCHYGAERLGCTVVPMSGGNTRRQVQLIRDFQPHIIMVTPSYLLTIAEAFEREGLDPRQSSLQTAICGAEPWTEGMRQEIEARWNLDAMDIYGLSEIIGPGVAQECVETKDGATIWEDHFYPEIVDPVTGEVLPDGERGELVFTTLTKQGMPMIRYRTRDLTCLLPPTARPMRRMARIYGRSDDMLIIRGVNVFPTQIEEAILAEPHLAPQFRMVVDRQSHLDTLEVLCELRAAMSADDSRRLGARLMLSTPAAIASSASPQRMARAAVARASRLDPHSRLTVMPGTASGRPASSSAMRATLRLSSPAWLAQP